ncbi:Cyclic pyranopterin monophosphate synthase, mitochondrial [Dimargaris xerosporica]|nr:Cyclic pyranopterin monophosphate synthase, mitochondrial [Dimargaris xerosporica]
MAGMLQQLVRSSYAAIAAIPRAATVTNGAPFHTTQAPQHNQTSAPNTRLTHVDGVTGQLRMVNIGDKPSSQRRAVARGRVLLRSADALALIQQAGGKKGDVLTVAKVAGVTGAKLTGQLIPLCHPIALDHVQVDLALDPNHQAVDIEAHTECTGKTGVEMEALTAVTLAGLTVIDMCKSVARNATLTEVRVIFKTGGKSGTYQESTE